MSYSKGQKLAFKCRITLETRGCIISICCRFSSRFHPANSISLSFTSTGMLQNPSNLSIWNTLKLNICKANSYLYKKKKKRHEVRGEDATKQCFVTLNVFGH